MSSPTGGSKESAQAWVSAFTDAWRAPAGAEDFAARIEPWLDPQVRLIQPQLPTLVGRKAFRDGFVGPLFDLIGELRGEVERSAIGEDLAFVEMTLHGTLGGGPLSWRICDRTTLRDGLVLERESYCDPLPLLRTAARRPRAWPKLVRQRLLRP